MRSIVLQVTRCETMIGTMLIWNKRKKQSVILLCHPPNCMVPAFPKFLLSLTLEYCNSVYIGLSLKATQKLQLFMNAAAKIGHILSCPCDTSASQVVLFTGCFKVLAVTYKALKLGYLRNHLFPIGSASLVEANKADAPQ